METNVLLMRPTELAEVLAKQVASLEKQVNAADEARMAGPTCWEQAYRSLARQWKQRGEELAQQEQLLSEARTAILEDQKRIQGLEKQLTRLTSAYIYTVYPPRWPPFQDWGAK